MQNFDNRAARKTLILFSCFLGYFFILPENVDGARHAANVENHYAGLSFADFISESGRLLVFDAPEGTNDDIFLHIVSYVVSLFGSSTNVFFLVIAFIYSSFYIRGLGAVYDLLPARKANYIVGLFLLLIFWKSFEGINTVRTWTATWIFFNGAFGYFSTGKRKYLWLVAFSPMVHFIYMIYSMAFWVVYFLRDRPRLYFGILIFSLVFKFAVGQSPILSQVIGSTSLGKEKLDIYALDDDDRKQRYDEKHEKLLEHGSFHKKYYAEISNSFTQLLLILLIFRYGYLKNKIRDARIFGCMTIGLLLWSFGNFLNIVPAVYNRGMIAAGIFILTAALLLFSKMYFDESAYKPRLNGLFNITKILMIFVIAVVCFNKVSAISSYMNAKLLVSPFLSLWFDANVSLREVIDWIK